MSRFFLLFLLYIPILVNGQTIRAVRLDGTTRTDVQFLQRLLVTKAGSELDSSRLQEDIHFLKSLPQFSGIQYQTDTFNDSVDIIFSLVESYTLLPSFGVGLIEDAPFIQLGINDFNLFGHLAQLSINYTWYDRHSFQLFYHNRYIRKSALGISANFEKRSTLEPVYTSDTSTEYLTDKYIIEILPGYNISRFIYAQAGVAFIKEFYQSADINAISGTGLPAELDTIKYLLKGVVTADKRQYQNQYISGWNTQFFAEALPKGNEPQPFIKIFSETRWYAFQNKWNYAGRWRMGIATNIPSPFAPFVIDSYINLRGSGNRIARGSAELTINQEIRYTIFERPWGAGQTVAFIDAGSWRTSGGELKELADPNQMLAFAGVGGRLYFQKFYNLVLRADYGINPLQTSQRGLVMGIGQYF